MAPWRLALVTIFQFLENLTDRQAADALRSRIDWKYSLSLPLTDAGWDASVLSEFRTRLVDGEAEMRLLDLLLQICHEHGWLKERGRQRTDSTHVLAKIRALNRLVCVAQTMVYVLSVLAEVAPSWVANHCPVAWVTRYSHRIEHTRLPQGEAARLEFANQVGGDGWLLLDALAATDTPEWLTALPVVATLRQIWEQQYFSPAAGGEWRPREQALPAAQMINSPYDFDARYAIKNQTMWVGYKVHFSETCDADLPHLLTHVQTTPATLNDDTALATIHAQMAARQHLPRQHIVDAGYVDARTLVASARQYAVELIGPTKGNY